MSPPRRPINSEENTLEDAPGPQLEDKKGQEHEERTPLPCGSLLMQWLKSWQDIWAHARVFPHCPALAVGIVLKDMAEL